MSRTSQVADQEGASADQQARHPGMAMSRKRQKVADAQQGSAVFLSSSFDKPRVV